MKHARAKAPSPAATADAYLRRLGERVRMLRNQRGMTRKALAAARESVRALSGAARSRQRQLLDRAAAEDRPRHRPAGHATGARRRRAAARSRAALAVPRAAAAASAWRGARAAAATISASRRTMRGGGASRSSACAAAASRRSAACWPNGSACPSSSSTARSKSAAAPRSAKSSTCSARRRSAAPSARRSTTCCAQHQDFVMATSGSIVTEPGTLELLLASCFTVWVRAEPEEHMKRVMAQGDMRPMANSARAMEDLDLHSQEPRAALRQGGGGARHQRQDAGAESGGTRCA